MNVISELHDEAMGLAEEAFDAYRQGELDRARRLFLKAYGRERAAAEGVDEASPMEPTRSILYRSAATLAFQAGDLDEAVRMIVAGLAGDPPQEMREELRELLNQVMATSDSTARGDERATKTVRDAADVMTDAQRSSCQRIIHTASEAVPDVTVGLALLPLADHMLLLPIQITMIMSLGEVFDIEMSESEAKAAALTTVATDAGLGVSQVLVGWIPMLGSVWSAISAATIIEKVGWAFAERFARGEIPGK